MTDLTKLLKERLEFDEAALLNQYAVRIDQYLGSAVENARLAPIHSALIECVVALEEIEIHKTYDEYENLSQYIWLNSENVHSILEALNKLREVLK